MIPTTTNKESKAVKKYSANLTETIDKKEKPGLITEQVKVASALDNGYIEDAYKEGFILIFRGFYKDFYHYKTPHIFKYRLNCKTIV